MPRTKTFKLLLEEVEETYLGKKVKRPFIRTYGKIYNKKDTEQIAYAIAKSKGIKIDRRKK